jgi:acyl-homoserine-lactone acylase
MPSLRFLLLAGLWCLCSLSAQSSAASPRTTLHWDRYGVPHIFAPNEAALFRAFGWAQAQSHGDVLLRLYGAARGRAAEYRGADQLASDIWVRTNGIPARAAQWLDRQPPAFRRNLAAFAEGITAYGREHGDRLSDDARRVLPVSAVDVLAHTQRVINFTFVTGRPQVEATIKSAPIAATAASNAWALSGQATKSGAPILLANPHLNWGNEFLFYEAHLQAPGVQVYGATLIGFPVIGIGFNSSLGWTHTVNPIDGADLFRLTPASDGYMFDGQPKAFQVTKETLSIRQPDGTLEPREITIRASVHGPIVGEQDGHPIALRVAGLDQPGLCEQWWDMGRATSLKDFEAALSRLQLPMFNVVYADRRGHILYVFNGRVPRRNGGTWREWNGIVSGDSSANMWTATLDYKSLPRVLDPPSGWLQNTNDPPWTATLPYPLDAGAYPGYLTSPMTMSWRTQRSVRLLQEERRHSFEEIVALKHSTRVELADRLLDDVLAAARGSDRPLVTKAAAVLAAWDRTTDASSRGAVLFRELADGLSRAAGGNAFAKTWDRAAPLDTPDGLADPAAVMKALEDAAARTEKRYGALDIPWGDVYRFRGDGVDLPGNGGPSGLGIFRVINFNNRQDRVSSADGGDSFVMVVEFGASPRAAALIGYGNASQPQSPHRTDQLELLSRKQLRPVWLRKADILANLERTETF